MIIIIPFVPELPDIMLYLHALHPRVVGYAVERVRIVSPFVVRSVDPPVFDLEGERVHSVRHVGKRIVFDFDGDLHAVIHLMIAGRFQWREVDAKINRKLTLLTFDFEGGSLHLTEAGTKKRASIHVVRGYEAVMREHDPGGIDVIACDFEAFRARLVTENRTLKRALTNPRWFRGIGNAYSDEILHRARLSPIVLTLKLTDDEIGRLHSAARDTLKEWIDHLIHETGDEFPKKITAFHHEMAVHGKFEQPCPVCSTRIARIVRAENEINYCPTCQTAGKVLKDRSLSRLLRDDWPREVAE